jgi:hypothetical protein
VKISIEVEAGWIQMPRNIVLSILLKELQRVKTPLGAPPQICVPCSNKPRPSLRKQQHA